MVKLVVGCALGKGYGCAPSEIRGCSPPPREPLLSPWSCLKEALRDLDFTLG